MTLDEKSKLCKKAGITYGQLQQIIIGCETKKEMNAAVNKYMRHKFLENAERIADGVNVYP